VAGSRTHRTARLADAFANGLAGSAYVQPLALASEAYLAQARLFRFSGGRFADSFTRSSRTHV